MMKTEREKLCNQYCEAKECVYRVPIFSHLGDKEIREIGKLINRKTYEPKTTVFSIGQPVTGLYILRYGSMKLTRYSPDGSEVIIDVLRRGDFYGGDQFFHHAVAREDGITLEKTGVCYIRERDLLEKIKSMPDIAVKIIQVISRMHSEDRTLISILSERDAFKRVALFLLQETEKDPESPLLLTREDIAGRIHLTHETVSRKLSQLRREGFIETKGYGHIHLKERKRLTTFLNLDLNQGK